MKTTLTGLLVVSTLLTAAPGFATSPSIPLENAVQIEWPHAPTVGSLAHITAIVTPELDLTGQLNVTLTLPPELSTSSSLTWTPLVDAGKTVRHTWSVDVLTAGLWKIQARSEVTETRESGSTTRTLREFHVYGLSSSEAPSETVQVFVQDLVPRDLSADYIEARANRMVSIRFTPTDWMQGGNVRLSQSPGNPWDTSFAVAINADDDYWTPVPDSGPITLEARLTDDPGPKHLRVAWQNNDATIDVTAACWRADTRDDPMVAEICRSGGLAIPSPDLFLALGAVAIAGVIHSRRP